MTGSTELPAEWTWLKLGGLQARLTLHCEDQMLKCQRKEGFALFTACACCGQDALAHSGDSLARRSANARACGSCSSGSSSCTSQNGRSAPVIGSGNVRSSCCGISGACVWSICSLLISCNFSPWNLCSWNCGWIVVGESHCGSWNGCGIWSRSMWNNFHFSYGKRKNSEENILLPQY